MRLICGLENGYPNLHQDHEFLGVLGVETLENRRPILIRDDYFNTSRNLNDLIPDDNDNFQMIDDYESIYRG